jgi:hypothetical protein
VAVKAYRKAMGLCYKCGLKWSWDHKCAPEVLHAINDLWESLFVVDCSSSLDSPAEHYEQVFLALSKSAVSGAPAPRTIQFTGVIEGLPISILIDSGSSSSFISDRIVRQLSSQTLVSNPTSVHVAGGDILISEGTLYDVAWSMDSYSFHSDLKILPLTQFDLIIGMDWMELHSPMQIHWKNKWL